jgi:hypothetical protein
LKKYGDNCVEAFKGDIFGISKIDLGLGADLTQSHHNGKSLIHQESAKLPQNKKIMNEHNGNHFMPGANEQSDYD